MKLSAILHGFAAIAEALIRESAVQPVVAHALNSEVSKLKDGINRIDPALGDLFAMVTDTGGAALLNRGGVADPLAVQTDNTAPSADDLDNGSVTLASGAGTGLQSGTEPVRADNAGAAGSGTDKPGGDLRLWWNKAGGALVVTAAGEPVRKAGMADLDLPEYVQ